MPAPADAEVDAFALFARVDDVAPQRELLRGLLAAARVLVARRVCFEPWPGAGGADRSGCDLVAHLLAAHFLRHPEGYRPGGGTDLPAGFGTMCDLLTSGHTGWVR